MTLETYQHSLPTCAVEVEEYPYFLAALGLLEMLSIKKLKKERMVEMIALFFYYRSKMQLADNLDVLDDKVSVHPRQKDLLGCKQALRDYSFKHFNRTASSNIF